MVLWIKNYYIGGSLKNPTCRRDVSQKTNIKGGIDLKKGAG